MKNKLELTWYNKDKSLYYDIKKGEYIWVDKNDPRVAEPRILIEKKQIGDRNAENLLIKGDNLLALKALQPEFTGKIKCIYIDPPFNTGSAFEHYEDGLEHSIWLTMMRDRLKTLWDLLSEDGSLFVHIDDNEQAYLRLLIDEIFGRGNLRNQIIVKRIKKNIRERTKVRSINTGHDFILFYAKSDKNFIVPPTKKETKEERWHAFDAAELRTGMDYDLFGHKPPEGSHWRWTRKRAEKAIKDGILRLISNFSQLNIITPDLTT